MSTADPADISGQIEDLITRLAELGETPATTHARELLQLLMELYGAGLSRILEIVRTEHGGPHATLERIATDPLLASLLVLHDLHPHPVEARVDRALQALRPHLAPETHVTFVVPGPETVHVTVRRGAAGQPVPPNTIRVAVERAIQEAAPEVRTIRVDGLDDPLIQIVRPSSRPVEHRGGS